ncbi:hypothetical protein [Solirhodobacter olei]|uniref:hypothetical protein n=1 Tax=Solirhodobacter olei TaxID=2493082 RepID=UPI0013E2A0E2|nr:hypothetical protein [Solirhodobacter olei]
MKTFREVRSALRNAAAYRRTVSQLRQLPNDLKLDLDIYDGDIPAIARRAIYGA